MPRTRLELHDLLVRALGSENVYYEPPETIKMRYPCIVYNLDRMHTAGANNLPAYRRFDSYTVTYIDPSTVVTGSDDCVPERLVHIPGFSYDRQFVQDDLHHYVFTAYTS